MTRGSAAIDTGEVDDGRNIGRAQAPATSTKSITYDNTLDSYSTQIRQIALPPYTPKTVTQNFTMTPANKKMPMTS